MDNVNLMIAWREFAANLPQEYKALSLQMNNLEPTMQEDGEKFLVVVDHPVIMNELNKVRGRIETYLRQRLENYGLTMQMRVRERTDKRRVFTRLERLNMMLEQSEALRKLTEEFQLELH